MNQNHIIAYDYLFQAQQALKAGDRKIAQEYCDLAKQVAPDLEEVWLLQASLAAPQESIVFLEKALAINPASERAKRGMVWAQNRLKNDVALEPAIRANISNEPIEQISGDSQQTALSDVSEAVDEPIEEISTPAAALAASVIAAQDVSEAAAQDVSEAAAQDVSEATPVARKVTFQAAREAPDEPFEEIPVAATQGVIPAATPPRPRRASASTSRTWITLASVAILIGLILVGYTFRDTISSTINVLLNGGNGDTTWSDVDLAGKGTATPAQVTLIPTEINNQAATALPLATSSPTMLPTLTSTTASTSTTVPTATESLVTVTPNPALAGQASPTPLPTDTGEPTFAPYATATITVYQQDLPSDVLTDSSQRWIDVNLSQQMVYAYEGDTVVNSFLTSTGTWEYPTVTGQYNVYVKYQYTDMSGADYYLANVPNTMYFYDGYAIHGTYWHNNFGTPMSHGCVNLSIPDSDWVFNWATVGTLVNVHY